MLQNKLKSNSGEHWLSLQSYRRRWLLSACTYNSWQQGNMRLTRNSRLINGWENSRRGIHCFHKTSRSTWQSVKQVLWRVSFVAVTFTSRSGGCLSETLTLEWEKGNDHSVSLLKHATVLGHVPWEFSRVFWHFLRHGETITCEVTDQR